MSVFWLGAPFTPLIGIWVDRYGPKMMLILEAVLESVSFIAMGYVDSMWALYLMRAIMGVGKILIVTAAAVSIPQWFDRRMGVALGIGLASFQLGGFFFAPLTQLLLDEFGWRKTAIGLGLMIGVASILPLVFRMPSKKLTDTMLAPARAAPSRGNKQNAVGYTLGEALRTRLLITILVLAALFYTTYAGLLSHLAPYFSDLNFSSAWTALYDIGHSYIPAFSIFLILLGLSFVLIALPGFAPAPKHRDSSNPA